MNYGKIVYHALDVLLTNQEIKKWLNHRADLTTPIQFQGDKRTLIRAQENALKELLDAMKASAMIENFTES